MRQTPLAQLIEARLGRSLAEYVAEARTAGKDWRKIAAEISADTDLSVTGETLRSWMTDALVVVPRSRVETDRATA